MNADDTNRLLSKLARRLREDQRHMAYVLELYRRRHGLDDEALMQKMGALPEMFVRLALCRRPEESSMIFDNQLRELSDYTLIKESLLRELIGQAREIPAVHHGKAAHSRLAILLPGTYERVLSRTRSAGLVMAATVLALACGVGIYTWLKSDKLAESQSETAKTEEMARPSANAKAQSNASAAASVLSPAPVQESPKGARKLPSVIRIDLEQFSVLRGPEGRNSAEQTMKMFPARNRILFTLSEGSSPGQYDVSIVDAFGKLLISEEARSATGKSLAIVLDMRRLSQKKYRLCVAKKAEIPDCYPLVITKSGKTRRKR
jgi:hypothetical protein